MRTLNTDLRWDESQALDFSEIKRILDSRGGQAKGLRCGYVDLESVHGKYDLPRFLPAAHNSCAILLTTRITHNIQRHWVCLLRNTKGVFFFDSLNLGYAMLTKILDDSGKFVSFLKNIRAKPNTNKLQSSAKMIRTCGLWTAVRIWCWKMSNPSFHHYITNAPSCLRPDQTVALMTMIGHI